MKNKMTKEQALGLGLAVAMPFIVATCDNGQKSEPQPEPNPECTCDKGAVHIDDCNNICSNGKGNAPCTHRDPKACECTAGQKANHFLPCECEAETPNVCDDSCCPVMPRGYITDKDYPNLNVPIYQKIANVPEDAADNIIGGYNSLSGANKYKLAQASNFKEIWIVDGENYDFDPITGIVEIGADHNANFIKSLLQYIVIPDLVNATLAHDAIRMASVSVPRYNRAMQLRDNRMVSRTVPVTQFS